MRISEVQLIHLMQEIYGGIAEMTYEENQAFFKIRAKIESDVMGKMLDDENNGLDHLHGEKSVYIFSTIWRQVQNKPKVMRKISAYMKESGLIGKWIDAHNIFVKW